MDLLDWDLAGLVDEADPDAAPQAGSTGRRCRIPIGLAREFLRVRVE